MPQPDSFDPLKTFPAAHKCPKCEFPMLLAIVEPSEKEGHDRRIFECLLCNHIETIDVKFR